MGIKYFSKLELPDYKNESFENFLLKGIDFKTNRLVEVNEKKEAVKHKNKSQHYTARGDEQYFYGFYESALKHYARALQENQNQVDAWVGQIRVLVDTGRFEDALFWADKGLAQFSGSEKMELTKALALAYGGKLGQAKKLINKPVKKNDSLILWLFRGEIMIKLKIGFFQRLIKPYKGITKIGAFFCFIKALESNPRDGFINQRIGITYLKAHDISRAYGHLKTSLITAPQNPLTLYCLAECYHSKRDYHYALYYTKKAIAFNPKLDAAIELLQRFHSPYRNFIRRVRKII